MRGADSCRHTLEARTVHLPVTGQMLAQMDHFMGQAREQRGGMTVAGFADPDERNVPLHAEIRRQARMAHNMKAQIIGVRTITRSIRAKIGRPPSSPASGCAAFPQPRSSSACAADTRAVAGPSSLFMIAAKTLTAALECLRASAFTSADALDFAFIYNPFPPSP